MINQNLKLLYDEHTIIVNAIDVSKQCEQLIGVDDIAYEKIIHQLIAFFRNYADKYHHFKEEEILFPEMTKRNEFLSDGVIKEMFDNHDEFRKMIKCIESNLNSRNFVLVQKELKKYGEALLDHISVENDEVFQMAESILSESELEKIFHRFLDCDRELGEIQKNEFMDLIESIRKQLYLLS